MGSTALVRQRPEDATRTTSVSVVVCTTGRRRSLYDLLRGLRDQVEPCEEIVVVENSATPGLSADAIAEYGARLVVERRRGLDVARNRGLTESTGDVVAYVDDDCLVSPGWVPALRRAFADPTVDLVTGRVVAHSLDLPSERAFEDAFPWDRGVHRLRFDASTVARWFPASMHHLGTGCNMAFRRRALAVLGGFDEALDMGTLVGGGGDMDAFVRAIDAGMVAQYEPTALVRHRHRGSMTDLRWQVWGYGLSQGATMAKGVLTRRGRRLAVLAFWWFRLQDRLRCLGRRVLGREPASGSVLALEAAGMVVGPMAYVLSRALAWVRRRRRSG